MKIKTICRNFDCVEEFDQLVNASIDEGWHLTKRAVIPGVVGVNHSRRLLYAELVHLDPEPVPEAEPIDPIDAVYAIKATCDAMPIKDCQGGRCPLYVWCCQLEGRRDPSDWDLPKKEVPEA
jgi:hypothetical protein